MNKYNTIQYNKVKFQFMINSQMTTVHIRIEKGKERGGISIQDLQKTSI